MLRSQHVATGLRILFRFQTGNPDNLLILGSLTVITGWASRLAGYALATGVCAVEGGRLPWENKVPTKCLPAPHMFLFLCPACRYQPPNLRFRNTRESSASIPPALRTRSRRPPVSPSRLLTTSDGHVEAVWRAWASGWPFCESNAALKALPHNNSASADGIYSPPWACFVFQDVYLPQAHISLIPLMPIP